MITQISKQAVGIIGGMGPQAGLELARLMHMNTQASCDQEHISSIILSYPSAVSDRSSFLLGDHPTNPALEIARQVERLAELGAGAYAIPCATCHAPPILSPLLTLSEKRGLPFINMIEMFGNHLKAQLENVGTLGILGTNGSLQLGVFENYLQKLGFDTVSLPLAMNSKLTHRAIYDPSFGIKATANEVHFKAVSLLLNAIQELFRLGAKGIVLGCTELSLAKYYFPDAKVFDPLLALARGLVASQPSYRLVERPDENNSLFIELVRRAAPSVQINTVG